MDRKQMCIANLQYKQPGRGSQARGLLRYLTYRESRDEAARQTAGRERWTDYGLGRTPQEIAAHCEAMRSDHVLLFSLVYNVNPDLIGLVPLSKREQFVRELTVKATETFFEQRGIDSGVEWSYVLHHRQTVDAEAPGRPDPHTHVVLPGTYYDDGFGERVPLYFNRNRSVDHIALLHTVTEQQMVRQMERYVGRDWEQRYDQLQAIRAEERAVTTDYEPTGTVSLDGDDFTFWIGSRMTDEATSAVGYYRTVEDAIEFRPLVNRLTHEESELLRRLFAVAIGEDFAALQAQGRAINDMSRADRDAFFAEVRTLNLTPSRDIDFQSDGPSFDMSM